MNNLLFLILFLPFVISCGDRSNKSVDSENQSKKIKIEKDSNGICNSKNKKNIYDSDCGRYTLITNEFTNGYVNYYDENLNDNMAAIIGKVVGAKNGDKNLILILFSCDQNKEIECEKLFWELSDFSSVTVSYDKKRKEVWVGNYETDVILALKWNGKKYKKVFSTGE